MTTLHRALLLAALPAAVLAAAAPARAAPARSERTAAFLLETGMDFGVGSEKLLTVYFDDGSSQTLSANDGLWVNAGASFLRFPWRSAAVDTVATIGLKWKSVGSGNDSVRYLAFPLEVTERLTYRQLRIGAGFSLALNPSYDGAGQLSDFHADVARSVGLAFRVDWIGRRADPRSGWYLGARFLWQKLEVKGSGIPFDANALGIAGGLEL